MEAEREQMLIRLVRVPLIRNAPVELSHLPLDRIAARFTRDGEAYTGLSLVVGRNDRHLYRLELGMAAWDALYWDIERSIGADALSRARQLGAVPAGHDGQRAPSLYGVSGPCCSHRAGKAASFG